MCDKKYDFGKDLLAFGDVGDFELCDSPQNSKSSTSPKSCKSSSKSSTPSQNCKTMLRNVQKMFNDKLYEFYDLEFQSDFSLVRCVLRVPCRVFKHIS